MAIAGYLLGACRRNDDGSEHWVASRSTRPLEIFGHLTRVRLITYPSKTPSQHVFNAFLTYFSELLPLRRNGRSLSANGLSGGGAAD
jgi:hypothetical protein